MDDERTELIIASNRLPVRLRRGADGRCVARASTGGLVSALRPVLARRGGAWIGWSGLAGASSDEVRETLGDAVQDLDVVPVELTREERDAFYLGFSNEIVWPLFHDLQTNCHFDPAYWDVYERVNRKFALAIARRVRPGDVVWIHDYHLMRVAEHLATLGVDNHVGFFLHIPFPSPDIYRKLPWREAIAEGLLRHDLVGVQTEADAANLTRSLCSVHRCERLEGWMGLRSIATDRTTHVGAYPIGVDWEREQAEVESDEAKAAATALRARLGVDHVLLGVDRLDYTKGIPQRLRAFRAALDRYPDLPGRATLVQLVVPSREDIPEYGALREEIERLVGEINGELSTPSWTPVVYMHGTVSRLKLRGWYRAADVALVTPLKDGMNLVAKEYIAAQRRNAGVLVLSEFAGAAAQLGHNPLLVNAYDTLGVAAAIAQACRMDQAERKRRMEPMRAVVRTEDVFRWAERFLSDLERAASITPPRRPSRPSIDRV